MVAPKYADLLQAASSGSKTLAERMSHHPALDSFLLKREKEAIKADFPVSEVEAAGVALAKELDDPSATLERLLGLSDEVRVYCSSVSMQIRPLPAAEGTQQPSNHGSHRGTRPKPSSWTLGKSPHPIRRLAESRIWSFGCGDAAAEPSLFGYSLLLTSPSHMHGIPHTRR